MSRAEGIDKILSQMYKRLGGWFFLCGIMKEESSEDGIGIHGEQCHGTVAEENIVAKQYISLLSNTSRC